VVGVAVRGLEEGVFDILLVFDRLARDISLEDFLFKVAVLLRVGLIEVDCGLTDVLLFIVVALLGVVVFFFILPFECVNGFLILVLLVVSCKAMAEVVLAMFVLSLLVEWVAADLEDFDRSMVVEN
jgi:hypothetical protein